MKMILLIIFLIGCSSGDSNITITHPCVEELPDYAIANYVLREIVIEDFRRDAVTTLRPRAVRGWLILKANLRVTFITMGGHNRNVEGYFDVSDGFMFVYLTEEYEDVYMLFQYHYGKSFFTLEEYDRYRDRRTTFKFNRLPLRGDFSS